MRIYQDGDDLPVVVCTELPDNEGMSITNAAEQIAAEVLGNHPDVFAIASPPRQASSTISPSSGSSTTRMAHAARLAILPPSTSWSSRTTSLVTC